MQGLKCMCGLSWEREEKGRAKNVLEDVCSSSHAREKKPLKFPIFIEYRDLKLDTASSCYFLYILIPPSLFLFYKNYINFCGVPVSHANINFYTYILVRYIFLLSPVYLFFYT